MDSEVLFWILILLFPVLSRILRTRKQKGQRPPAQRQPSAPREASERELTPFEEALREIQEALTESKRSEAPEPPPQPTAPTRLKTVRKEAPKPSKTPPPVPMTSEFHPHAPPAYEDKPHFFDEQFDREAPYSAPGRDEHYHDPLDAKGDKRDTTIPGKSKKLGKWQQTVANIEVLGPPRSKRPWTSPWK